MMIKKFFSVLITGVLLLSSLGGFAANTQVAIAAPVDEPNTYHFSTIYTIDLSNLTNTTYSEGYVVTANTITFNSAASNSNVAFRIIKSTTARRLVIDTGLKVNMILDGVTMTTANSPIDLMGTAELELYLEKGTVNSVKSTGNFQAGIKVQEATNAMGTRASLTINGPGSLEVTAGSYGAGIGGNGNSSSSVAYHGGDIIINGGKIKARGGLSGAGIGGGGTDGIYGNNPSGAGTSGVIQINGGDVTAIGGDSSRIAGGAGIGSGGTGATITTAGTVNAGRIVIAGGNVKAQGGSGGNRSNLNDLNNYCDGAGAGAGIGGGGYACSLQNPNGKAGNGGNISIAGGTVVAVGGGLMINEDGTTATRPNNYGGAAGIGGGGAAKFWNGSGKGGDGGTIAITGGNVTAIGSFAVTCETSGYDYFGAPGIGAGVGQGTGYLAGWSYIGVEACASNGSPATLTISSAATVKAFCAGNNTDFQYAGVNLPAIHANYTAGSGNAYVVNHGFFDGLSKTAATVIDVYNFTTGERVKEEDGQTDVVLKLPANYRNFGYTTGGAAVHTAHDVLGLDKVIVINSGAATSNTATTFTASTTNDILSRQTGHTARIQTWLANKAIVRFMDGDDVYREQYTFVGTASYGGKAVKPVDPVKEEASFLGWYTKDGRLLPQDWGTTWNFATTLTTANTKATTSSSGVTVYVLTLYARWSMKFTVTFDSDGGSAVAAQKVADGSTATKPADPKKDSNTFLGWYTANGDEYDFSTPVTADITLYARWKQPPPPADERANKFKIADLSGYVDQTAYKAINTSNTGAVVRVMVLCVAVDTPTGALLPEPAYTMSPGWVDGGDGWWYYTSVLNASDTLGDNVMLFTTAPVAPNDATLTVQIKAEFSGIGRTGTTPANYHYAFEDAWFGGTIPTAAPIGGANGIDETVKSAINAWFTAKQA